MARKTKPASAEVAAVTEHDYDPSGHYDFCIVRISPPGHRPSAQCLLRVWWHQRRPVSWRTRKAAGHDHNVEHACREWTSEEDARVRALMETVSAERYSIKGDTARSLAKMAGKKASDDALGASPAGTWVVEDDLPLRPAPQRQKGKPVERAPSGVTLDGEAADANLRTARKVHACSACDATIGHGVKYLESRVGAKSAFDPFRYCGKCWAALKYSVPS